MCLATPLQVISVNGDMAKVGASGFETTVALDLVEDVAPGDFVIVHAGFAIQKLEPDEAREVLAVLQRLGD